MLLPVSLIASFFNPSVPENSKSNDQKLESEFCEKYGFLIQYYDGEMLMRTEAYWKL